MAFFVPEMKGMNEQIKLSGTLYNVVNHFKIKNLDLRLRKNTFLRGDLDLPDFSDFAAYPVRENIRQATIDMAELGKVRLPDGNFLNLGTELSRLGTIRFSNMVVDGKRGMLTLQPLAIRTEKGSVDLRAPMRFDVLGSNTGILNLRPDSVALALNHVQLGEILGVPEVGMLHGTLKFSTFDVLKEGYSLTKGSGYFSEIEAQGYVYHKVALKKMQLSGAVLTGKIQLDDPHAKATVEGEFNVKGLPNYRATLAVEKLDLGHLGFAESKTTTLSGACTISMNGSSFDQFEGGLTVNQFNYLEEGKEIAIPSAKLDFTHSKEQELLTLRSPLADLDFKGKIDPKTILDDVLFGISRVVPSLVQSDKPVRGSVNNEMDARVVVKNLKAVTDLFLPGLELAANTELIVKFDSDQDLFGVQLTSNRISYDSLHFEGINLQQRVNSSGVTANLLVNQFDAGDSLIFHDLNFLTTGIDGRLNSSLGWDQGRLNESRIRWKTIMLSSNDFDLLFDQSRFSINGFKWYLDAGSDLVVNDKHVQTTAFKLRSDQKNQRIEADGCLSENRNDVLSLRLTNLDLSDLSTMFNLEL